MLFNAEPNRVCGFMNLDPNFGTDRLFSGIMDFDGRISSFTCSTQLAKFQRVNILGTTGRIEIPVPFNAPPDKPCQIILQQDGMEETIVSFDVCDQFTIQADLMSKAILEDTPVPTPLTDAWANMHTIEALLASAKSGEWMIC